MRRLLLLFTALIAFVVPAQADVVDTAFEAAFATVESVRRQLAPTEFGVDIAAYRDALSLSPFRSPHWGRELQIEVVRGTAEGACTRFAAYVPLPPQDGTVPVVICPKFLNGGTDGLRTLTVLHELVHAVAGPSECRAMALAAKIEQLSTGSYTPVDRYWRENGCEASEFSLP